VKTPPKGYAPKIPVAEPLWYKRILAARVAVDSPRPGGVPSKTAVVARKD